VILSTILVGCRYDSLWPLGLGTNDDNEAVRALPLIPRFNLIHLRLWSITMPGGEVYCYSHLNHEK
jgi:hypothetical protein